MAAGDQEYAELEQEEPFNGEYYPLNVSIKLLVDAHFSKEEIGFLNKEIASILDKAKRQKNWIKK